MAAYRQRRRPTQSGGGKGIDKFGGPVVDPTENVLALVDAESKTRDLLREADNRYQDAMRDAETRRIDQLLVQKGTFDFKLAEVLQASQDAASTLLATQLKEVKNDLASRVSELEQFRWSSSGRTSVIAWILAGLSIIVAIAAIVATRL